MGENDATTQAFDVGGLKNHEPTNDEDESEDEDEEITEMLDELESDESSKEEADTVESIPPTNTPGSTPQSTADTSEPSTSTTTSTPTSVSADEDTPEEVAKTEMGIVVDELGEAATERVASRGSTREWEQLNIKLPPGVMEDYTDRWYDFKHAYEREHQEDPAKSAQFHAAIFRAAFSDASLEGILEEVFEQQADYVL